MRGVSKDRQIALNYHPSRRGQVAGPQDEGRGWAILLRIEPEMHHVAVGDDVFLAFQPQLAGVAGAGFAESVT